MKRNLKGNLKRTFSLLLSGVVLTAALAGCGNGDGGRSGNEDKKETSGNNVEGGSAQQTGGDAKEAAADGALTVSGFYYTFTENFLNALHEACPEITLDFNCYPGTNGSGYAMRSLEHGDIPDIFVSTYSFGPESQEKYLLDLSNYDFINQYSGSLLDAQDVNGGIYLLPTSYKVIGINYNKTILEENGWEVPNSFDELTALAEEIEAAGYEVFGNGMDSDGYIFSYLFNLGNTVYFGTPEGTEWKEDFPVGKARAVGNSGVKELTEYFQEWLDKGFFKKEHVPANDFFEGKCVFYTALGISKYEHTAENGKTYEFGIMPWLSRDGGNNMLTIQVQKYLGLNKSLAEKGNEQKLENALKFMEYLSTVEGQQSFISGDHLEVSSLIAGELTEDSPFYEVSDLIYGGRTIPLVYGGWEPVITPVADKLRLMLDKELDADGFLAAFDEINDAVLSGVSEDMYGTASETLTLEQTAALVAIAEGKAVDADCAMISLNEWHGPERHNRKGLPWYLYEGQLNTEALNVIRPNSNTISTLEMTGAEIKAMRDAGFDMYQDGNPFPYLLFTKGDIELDDDATYKLAISTGELTEDMLEKAVEWKTAPVMAIEEYVKELGTVSADVISWD